MQRMTARPSCRAAVRSHSRGRTAATTVEMAVALLPLVILIIGSIEFGRGLMVLTSLEEAARLGCRMAILDGATTATIEQEVASFLSPANIDEYDVVVQPSQPDTVATWDPISVTITASFNDLTWFPMPRFLKDVTYSASCTLLREGNDNT